MSGTLRLVLVAVGVCFLGGARVAGEMTVPYPYGDGKMALVPVVACPADPGEMARVNVTTGPSAVEIDGSRPFFLRHGFCSWNPECLSGMDFPSLVAWVLDHVSFELRLNGEVVVPDYICVSPLDGSDGCTPGGAAWFYLFAANTLEPGVYIFQARHTWRQVPTSCWPTHLIPPTAEESFTEDALRLPRTVTVVYP